MEIKVITKMKTESPLTEKTENMEVVVAADVAAVVMVTVVVVVVVTVMVTVELGYVGLGRVRSGLG